MRRSKSKPVAEGVIAYLPPIVGRPSSKEMSSNEAIDAMLNAYLALEKMSVTFGRMGVIGDYEPKVDLQDSAFRLLDDVWAEFTRYVEFCRREWPGLGITLTVGCKAEGGTDEA
jgi:hypothetical protein